MLTLSLYYLFSVIILFTDVPSISEEIIYIEVVPELAITTLSADKHAEQIHSRKRYLETVYCFHRI